jgi:phosphatidate cytidylyltransferase
LALSIAVQTTACVLRTRLWTALIALPLVIAMVLFAPPRWFTIFIGVLMIWGLYEVAEMFRVRDTLRRLILLAGGVFGLAMLHGFDAGWWLAAIVILIASANVWLLARHAPERLADNRLTNITAAALWVGVLFPYFALLRNSRDGVAAVILLVVVSDSGAYFAGKSLGRRKLAPRVSPNKTVEGAIGGLVACVLAAIILWTWLAPGLRFWALTLLAVSVGLLSQLGDLTGSAFKRIAGVKDSGWIFPGHGGLLDRTCSLVFPAVFTYYYLR